MGNGNDVVASAVEASIVAAAPVATGAAGGSVDLPPDPSSLQTEIDRLQRVKEKADLEAKDAEDKAIYWRKEKAGARADYFKERGGASGSPSGQPAAAVPADVGPDPKKEDFDDYDKFIDAKLSHIKKQAKAEWDQDQLRKARDVNRQQRDANLQTKIDEGFKKYPDFEAVALDWRVPITRMVKDILAECDSPADVAYYLGKNQGEALRISQLNPVAATRAIARIEAEMVKAGGGAPLSPPRIPSAPEPIRPLHASAAVSKDPEKMSQQEYEAWRASQGARRF